MSNGFEPNKDKRLIHKNHSINENMHKTKDVDNLTKCTRKTTNKGFKLEDIIPFMVEAFEVIEKDDISECFLSEPNCSWNWSPYLFVFWAFGVCIRFLVLFPIRLLVLLTSMIIFFFFGAILVLTTNEFSQSRVKYSRKLIKFLASAFILSWMAVVKTHGVIPAHKSKQIFVANHSSMIDFILLSTIAPFAAIGQIHTGWVGWFQTKYIKPFLGGIWFKRDLPQDRQRCAEYIRKYIATKENHKNRLLIFPEGTCSNSKYCIQFKKGAFDLGAEVCPIAIKYNESYNDAFWNSRQKSFAGHLFDLMTSWTLVVDVYFLKPEHRKSEETAEAFAARVKKEICRAARLTNKEWNGYLKYLPPPPRFVEYRRKKFAESLEKKVEQQVVKKENKESDKKVDEIKRRTHEKKDTLLENILSSAAENEMEAFFNNLKRTKTLSPKINNVSQSC